jgi:hypothetical protein
MMSEAPERVWLMKMSEAPERIWLEQATERIRRNWLDASSSRRRELVHQNVVYVRADIAARQVQEARDALQLIRDEAERVEACGCECNDEDCCYQVKAFCAKCYAQAALEAAREGKEGE